MKATTVKIEGALLTGLKKFKPASLSVSAYVRGLIEGDIRRQSLAAAAREYQGFLASQPSEQEWLDHWMQADLANSPGEPHS